MRALLVLSGGLDSAACLQLSPVPIALAVTFDYGQSAAQQELRAAQSLARAFHIEHRSIALTWFYRYDLRSRPIPTLVTADLDNLAITSTTASAVWIANRNGVFIEVAAAIAEAEGLTQVVVGFNREEAQTFPDNSAGYVEAINGALKYSTRGRVQVASPTLHLTKSEIVAKLKPLDFPWRALWSCYQAGPLMCGLCESCLRLKRALTHNEVPHDGLFIN